MSQSHSEQELLARISELESENKRLKQKTKYGLVWEDKPEKVVQDCENKYPVLIENGKRRIIDKDSTKPTNILIEGDNYHALSVLNYTHRGKIDVIYIDPPYNTGNKDFIYNDHYIDREDAYRHSKWLSFMEKRLKLAKDLLSESGVIFISIDDNEQAQLKLLCDSVFGNQNHLSTIIWKSRQATGKQVSGTNISTEHEYLLTYQSGVGFNGFFGVSRNRESYKNPDNDTRGDWAKHPLDVGATKIERPNCYYTLIDPVTGNKYEANPNRVWAFSKETMSKLLLEGKIIFDPNGKNRPGLKKFWTDLKSELKPFSSVILPAETDDFGYNTEGTKILNDIFGGDKIFDYPKPVSIIQGLIKQVSNKDSTILDFMAGSGTTGHAVMELNKQDGGNRQYILCTNNENNICEEVAYERLKRVMKGYKNKKGEMVEGLGGNLEYLQCKLIDKTKHTDNMKVRMVNACTEMLCLKEGTFHLEKETKHDEYLIYRIYSGMDFSNTIPQKKYVGIYYDLDESYLDIMRQDLKGYGDSIKHVYIFSLRNTDDTIDDYRTWRGINIEEIPQKILEIYETIYKQTGRNK